MMGSNTHSSTDDGSDQLQALFLVDHDLSSQWLSKLKDVGGLNRTWYT